MLSVAEDDAVGLNVAVRDALSDSVSVGEDVTVCEPRVGVREGVGICDKEDVRALVAECVPLSDAVGEALPVLVDVPDGVAVAVGDAVCERDSVGDGVEVSVPGDLERETVVSRDGLGDGIMVPEGVGTAEALLE